MRKAVTIPTEPMDNQTLKGELINLLLTIEQERKSHTAKLLFLEEQIRGLLGEPNRANRKKSTEWTMPNGRKRTVVFEDL
jgi:hypothetical protein